MADEQDSDSDASRTKEEITKTVIESMKAPEEAIEAFPDECANCGASASSFWIPNDYHKQPHHKRDPGICTECGHHFGTGK